jgi:hypothetical protein
VAVKKSKISAKLIYEEDSDDRDFIDDSELVDDESDKRSGPLYYYPPVFLPYMTQRSQQEKPARKRAWKGKMYQIPSTILITLSLIQNCFCF